MTTYWLEGEADQVPDLGLVTSRCDAAGTEDWTLQTFLEILTTMMSMVSMRKHPDYATCVCCQLWCSMFNGGWAELCYLTGVILNHFISKCKLICNIYSGFDIGWNKSLEMTCRRVDIPLLPPLQLDEGPRLAPRVDGVLVLAPAHAVHVGPALRARHQLVAF